MPIQIDNIQSLLLAIGLLMARMMMAFSLLPLFSGNAIPASVRVSFVAGLSICLLPLIGPQTALLKMEWGHLFPYLLKEAALGTVLGLMSSLAFWALHAAGEMIEYQAGLSMSTVIDPLSGREDSLVGGLFLQLFNVLFLASGGLLILIGMLFESYRVWPVDRMLPLVGNIKLMELLVSALTGLIELVIKIAAPFVILMLVAELALGLLSRFAPQLNVFFLALPVKIIILAVLLLLFCSLLMEDMRLIPDFPGLLQQLNKVMK